MSELISIIVPVYNVEPYLVNCIDSILSQNYRDTEVILVDDGSTDQSGVICDKYAKQDRRIRVFHLQNGGVSAARNFGIKQATGDYLMFVDSDDEMVSDTLCEVTKHFSQNADLYIFGTRVIRKESQKIILPEYGVYDPKSFGDVYIHLYSQFIINSPVNKVFRKDLIKDTTFPLHMSLGEDLLFCNSYLRNCKKIVTIDKDLYIYKQRESGSLATKYYENLFDIYQEHYRDVVRTMNALDPGWKRENCDMLYQMYMWYIKQSINMTLHPQNCANVREKYLEIKKICKHSFTQECVAHVQSNKLYDIFLVRQCAIGILIYVEGAKIKSKVTRYI